MNGTTDGRGRLGRFKVSPATGAAASALVVTVLTALILARPVNGQVARPAPTFKQYAPGLLARTLYSAGGTAAPFQVQIWELMAGPGQVSQPATLPGGAVIEVQSGGGAVTVDDKRREVKAGGTLAIDEGVRFSVDNRQGENALSLRVVVISRGRN